MEHHNESVSVHQTCSATHVNLENPPQPRNLETFEYGTKQVSQVGWDYKDWTLPAHKTVAKVFVKVAAAPQMAITAVMFVRSEGEHRNATASETTTLFENSYLALNPKPSCNSLNS